MDAIRKQLDVLMGANRNGDVTVVSRKYYDRDVCRLFLAGLCPHDLFQLTVPHLTFLKPYTFLGFLQGLTYRPVLVYRDYLGTAMVLVPDVVVGVDVGYLAIAVGWEAATVSWLLRSLGKETWAVARQRAEDAVTRIVIATAVRNSDECTVEWRVVRCRPCQNDVAVAVGDVRRRVVGGGCWQRRLGRGTVAAKVMERRGAGERKKCVSRGLRLTWIGLASTRLGSRAGGMTGMPCKCYCKASGSRTEGLRT
ncbi:hypothetical protein GW17_00038036 [Ensete ventricosum]|nr:hypothetical protein GW17_00038036 [Ensete ventricosum]